MPDEERVYHGPSFQFYAGDFLKDTMHLSTVEIGAYMLLICHAWEHGGIPKDKMRIAQIARVPVRQYASVWQALGPFFKDHPIRSDLYVQPRLEKVREWARSRSEKHSEIAKKRWSERTPKAKPEQSPGNATAEREHMRTHSQGNALQLHVDTSTPSDSLRSSSSVDAPGAIAPEASPPKNLWQDGVRSAARALSKRPLSSLSPDERLALSRYHALEFANCTKSEPNNKSHAVKIAGAFATMGRNKNYGDMTVAEYVGLARKVFAQREETPFFDPWLIRAFVEFEGVA